MLHRQSDRERLKDKHDVNDENIPQEIKQREQDLTEMSGYQGLEESNIFPMIIDDLEEKNKKSLQDPNQYEVQPSALFDVSREREQGSNKERLDSNAFPQNVGYQQ